MSSASYSTSQQYLMKARRRLVLVQTVAKFEEHFRYPLWESEVEYLADLLKVERGRGYEADEEADEDIKEADQEAANEDAGEQDTSNEDAANEDAANEDTAIEDAANEDIAIEDAAIEDAAIEDAADQDEDAADQEVEKAERETDEALAWLQAQWEFIFLYLKQTQPHLEWEGTY